MVKGDSCWVDVALSLSSRLSGDLPRMKLPGKRWFGNTYNRYDVMTATVTVQ